MDMRPNRPTSYPKESMSAYLKRSLIRMVRLWILLSLLPLDVVWATSASISISGNEGLITLTASASFSTYVQCNPPNSTNCTNVNSGTLYVYQNGSLMQRVSGNGSVSWSTTMDGGSMGQGEYTFTASAVDSVGESNSQTTSITIDNTPAVTVASPGLVHGAFDIYGTIEFKERVSGNEGSIEIYIDTTAFGSYFGWRYYEGTSINWGYSQVVGSMLDAGSWGQGTHNIYILARASNGATSWGYGTFVIDNTPAVTVHSLGHVEGAFDINGTVEFKQRVNGNEGTIQIYLDVMPPALPEGWSNYEGTMLNWSYSQVVGRMLDAGSLAQGTHTIHVLARASNGASSWGHGTFIIDNTPGVTVQSPGQVEGVFDIFGTIRFKGRVDGKEGSVEIYINGKDAGHYEGWKEYEGTTINWSYSQIVGRTLNAASWPQAIHTVYVRAKAYNNAYSEWAQGTFEVTQFQLAKNLGDGCGPCETRPRTTNPINFAVGNKHLKETDLALDGPGLPLGFKRCYNSKSSKNDALGYGWSGSFSERLTTATGKVILTQADGAEIHFIDNGQGKFISETDQARVIEPVSGGGRRLTEPDGKVLTFNSSGQLTQLGDRNGNALSLTYPSGKLSSVQDNFGRRLQFAYNPEGRLRTIDSPVGQYVYAYDSRGNLESVTNPELKARIYLYEDAADSHNVTGIINEKGIRSATFAYDSQDRATLSQGHGGMNKVEISYENNYVRKVKDSLGRTTSYKLFLSKGIGRVKSSTGSGCASCLGSPGKEYELSERLLIGKETDARGTAILYTYDDRGNILTKKEAGGTSSERTVSYTYHPIYNLITSITRASIENPGQSAVTSFTYDQKGNLLSKTETGYSGGSSVSRTTTYTYNVFGQVSQLDGPRLDVLDITSFEYYPNESNEGLNRGMLRKIADALGHEITFMGYNAYGKPFGIKDSNGLLTNLAYDGMGRLISRTVGGRTTSFEYDETGNLLRTFLANGLKVVNAYSPSGLLERIEDNAGHYIQYFYDTEGNPIREEIHDRDGVLRRFAAFEYDDYNRLKKILYPGNYFEERGYDSVGNLIRRQDPNGNATVYNYDAFNRLITVLEPNNAWTRYAYDSHDHLITVTDAENHITIYTYSDLGELLATVSPDTNTTNYNYDSAGNMVLKRDANGNILTYTYDALNRLTALRFPDSSQDITYGYDNGANGKGRLTGMTDPGGSAAYTYDEHGSLRAEERRIDGISYVTRYEYDAASLLTGMTYPSGRSVSYDLDTSGRIKKVSSNKDSVAQSLASNLSYVPFGPLQSQILGNGINQNRGYDQQYRLTTLASGSVQSLDYTLDPTGNITGIRDNVEAGRSQTFTYDNLHRLTGAVGLYGTLTYAYDRVGNRLSEVSNTQTDTYSYFSGTNKLSQIAGPNPVNFTYDSNGNTAVMGEKSFVYNQNNRLIRALNNGVTVGEYTYNGQGQRVKKVAGGKTTVFIYDKDGCLITEYDSQGNVTKEYVFFEGAPLAQFVSEAKPNLDVEIRASKGGILSGVKVYAFKEAGSYTGVYATTDEKGTAIFRKSELPDWYYKFRVDYLSSQFWSEVVHLPEANEVQVLIEEQTAEVAITIAGGAKEGVKVYLFNEAGTYLGLFETTDSEGKVYFDLPAGKSFKFRADYLSNQYWTGPVVTGGGGATFLALNAGGGQLTLTLEDGAGQALPGIKTYLFSSSGSYLGLSETTDGSGKVSFMVSGGNYKIRADYLGHQVWSETIAVYGDTASSLTIPHQDVSVAVEGDYNGSAEPRPNINVYLYTASGSYLGINCVTDQKGEAIFHLPEKEYKIRADYLSKQYWSEVFSWTDETITINEGMAEVRVSNMGQSVAGVPVYVFNSAGTYLNLGGSTDYLGMVSFRLPEGEYKFRADYMGSQYWSGNTVFIADVKNPIGISTGGGAFALTVQKGDNNPLVGVSCSLFSATASYLGSQGVTNSSGEVGFKLADGSYKIRIDYTGYQFWTDVFSIPSALVLTYTIPHADVAVTVNGDYSDDVVPMENVSVYLFTPGGAYPNQARMTNDLGNVTFNLPKKDYKVRVDYLSQQYWSDLSNSSEKTLTIPEGIAEIHVLRAGNSLSGVDVFVFNSGGSYLNISERTDANGTVSFRLPVGTYKFRVDYQGSQYWATETVDPDEVNEMTLDTGGGPFRFTVEKAQGDPLVNLPVYVFTSAGNYLSLTAKTSSQGQVEFDLSQGSYKLRVDYLGYQFWSDVISVPTTLSATMTIPHKDVRIRVNQTYQSQFTPLGNVRVYLFTPGGSYLSKYADTTAQGEVVFSLPEKGYKARVDYLGSQTWSQVFPWQDQDVDINHGRVDLHVTWNGQNVVNAPVYLFTETGSYLNRSQKTNADGHVLFEVPAKAYKFRVDYGGKQYWSGIRSVMADQEIDVEMPLDQMALMPTNNPKPARYDGEPPIWNPEPIRLAGLGSLAGILSQAAIASTPSPVLYYCINDHLGTPQLLLDANGSVAWQATYKPFGEAMINPTPTFSTNLRFPGQYYDIESSLYYNYFRYLQARIGRYISPDPMGFDEYKNTYNYSLGNPISMYDPNGLWPTSIHNLIIRSNFGFLPSNLRMAIERGSRFADTLQDPRFAYIHAMRNKNQHPEVARKLMEAFIRDRLRKFQCESERGNLEEAYVALGEALHSVMDSTSPTHEGFQWWDYLRRMPENYICYHWLTEQWYLNSEISRTVDYMNQVLRENRINLRQ